MKGEKNTEGQRRKLTFKYCIQWPCCPRKYQNMKYKLVAKLLTLTFNSLFNTMLSNFQISLA